ncbi:DUF4132 domain-containing protein [Chitinophaga arvensicola]|uniref:DUF4132 domain-containing protein n=1 Tax=Chitinophaga arvensicola TaxID=29529 RepID=A0A1I0SDZ9_9BACT|nr:DUF4132 domain-containing protein [Chitinophaga arvensicola]SEW57333.1 protein of unknown function [Chitinophaga arvensicola]
MPYTKEALLPHDEKLKQLTDYENISDTLQTGVDFLTGHTYETPVFPTVETARQMGHFISLLQLPEHWNDNDRLVLKLISPTLTWNACKDTFLTTVIPMMDMPGTSSSIVLRFSYFTSFLQQRGCTPEEIGSLLISYSGDGQNFDLAPLKFTPMRKFLQDLIKSAERHIIDAYLNTWRKHGWNSLFFRLLVKGHPDREMEYLENILLQPGHQPDQQEITRVLLQNNPGKYEPLIERSAEQLLLSANEEAALYRYHHLAGHLPEKYNPRLLKAVYNYLDKPESSQPAAKPGAAESPANTGIPNNENPAGAATAATTHRHILSTCTPAAVIAVRDLLQLDAPAAVPYLKQLFSRKRALHPEAFQVLADELKDNAAPMLLQALEYDYDARTVLPVLTQLNKSGYLDQLWPYTLHKLKSVRTLVAVALAEHPQAMEKAAALLEHKKADQRLTAVQILCKLEQPAAKALLQQALHKEVNDDARDLMLETLGGHTLTDEDDTILVNQLVGFAKKRHKLNKPAEKWLDDKALPPLYLLDGSVMTTDMMRFLLYRMSRVKEVCADVEAKPLLRLIDRSRSGDFARSLYKAYADQGGDLKLKYLMTITALLGDDLLADTLREDIQLWIDTKRLKMAEHGVGALALHGSMKALREVEFLSRRYSVRKGVVGAAALAALQLTANTRGITLEELGDHLVPDFGFQGRYSHFEVKGERYRAFLDQHFKPAYLNDKGRRLKAIPVATSGEIRAHFKALPKTMASAIKLQTQRLEHFLETKRQWSVSQWTSVFQQNPVMSVFAGRLVWGIYDEAGKLVNSFYCTEDITPTSLTDETLALAENTHIRILHPADLDADTLQLWKNKLATLSVSPVFPQLERPVAASPQQAYSALSHDFGDISMESDVFNQYMEEKDWKLNQEG